MTLKIKLQRKGRKKKPIYRIVIQDSRTARDGKTIDIIGKYDPLTEPMLLELNEEKVKQWISNGAKPTEAVHRLLAIKGYVEAKKYVEKKETKTIETIQEKEEIVTEETVEHVTKEEAPVIEKKQEVEEQKPEEQIIQEEEKKVTEETAETVTKEEAPVIEKEQEVKDEKPEIDKSK